MPDIRRYAVSPSRTTWLLPFEVQARMALDLETAYRTILAAARQGKYLAYGELAKAQGVDWGANRNQIFSQLGKLLREAHEKNWPLLPAIVVNQAHITDGRLEGAALTGFINDVKRQGVIVDDPEAFLKAEQSRVFAWAPNAPDTLVDELAGPKFIQLFDPVLDALRALGGSASPKAVGEWIKAEGRAPEGEVDRLTKSGQSSYGNRVGWARFYLTKAGILENKGRGIWALTDAGRDLVLGPAGSLELFKEVRRKEGYGTIVDDEAPPDDSSPVERDVFSDPGRQFWFGGAKWDGTDDQTERFLAEGVWQNGTQDKFSAPILSMRPGDRIAIKSTFVRKHGLPFDNKGKPVSCMKIKAVGTVTSNRGDGVTVDVEWRRLSEPREWYFYTYRNTLARANLEDDHARRLIRFTFGGAEQDYAYFLKFPYWAKQYGETAASEGDLSDEIEDNLLPVVEEAETAGYDTSDIVKEGCFLPGSTLEAILARLMAKKNLVLQGPPGTGKTWLAKRLAKALIGSAKPLPGQIRSVQFHPSLAYEDFVRGWRPSAEGKLALTDGVFLEIIDAAKAQPDAPHVLVIEEINRGNPAQLFGEMLTLLEDSKRHASEALELAYRRNESERVYLPENLYVIGTMNVADRSLALVDLALRRRFAFVSLEPSLNEQWRTWCEVTCGFPRDIVRQVADRMAELNKRISEDRSLGTQFCVGHSYVTPRPGAVSNPAEWFRDVVDSEIIPLLEEYWYDSPDKLSEAAVALREPL
jgi:5-methylcytosine-specific restriction protein B